MVPLSKVPPEGADAADVFDGLGAAGETAGGALTGDDVPAADARGVDASTDVPVAVGTADALADLPGVVVAGVRNDFAADDGGALTDEVEGVDVLADAPAREGGTAVDVPDVAPATMGAAVDAPASVGMAVADAPSDAPGAVDVPNDGPAALGAAVPGDAPARTAPAGVAVGGFAAGEAPLGVTPTGLEIFLAA